MHLQDADPYLQAIILLLIFLPEIVHSAMIMYCKFADAHQRTYKKSAVLCWRSGAWGRTRWDALRRFTGSSFCRDPRCEAGTCICMTAQSSASAECMCLSRASEFADPMLCTIVAQYAGRLPIGLKDIIQGVPADVVRSFYERWYRPEHQAVVVTGDFDPDAVVAMLTEKLEGCQSRETTPAPAIPRSSFPPSFSF